VRKRVIIAAVGLCTLLLAASAGAVTQRLVNVSKGDVIVVRGTRLVCVVPRTGATSIQCYKANSRFRADAGDYSISLSMAGVAVVKISRGNRTQIIFKRRH
jgi:hypothetical protein